MTAVIKRMKQRSTANGLQAAARIRRPEGELVGVGEKIGVRSFAPLGNPSCRGVLKHRQIAFGIDGRRLGNAVIVDQVLERYVVFASTSRPPRGLEQPKRPSRETAAFPSYGRR